MSLFAGQIVRFDDKLVCFAGYGRRGIVFFTEEGKTIIHLSDRYGGRRYTHVHRCSNEIVCAEIPMDSVFFNGAPKMNDTIRVNVAKAIQRQRDILAKREM